MTAITRFIRAARIEAGLRPKRIKPSKVVYNWWQDEKGKWFRLSRLMLLHPTKGWRVD